MSSINQSPQDVNKLKKKVKYKDTHFESRNAYHKQDSAALLCIKNVTQVSNGPFQKS